ncbi:late embryogenesis abundant protein At1g64065-like [Salvia splendens]|uniref:late embryogenesis abundant protein At1g64065-like n=1 Tax=Salvia splendens TaxID=180675 RepID=UPI001C279F50|nr:late embryogenesis abundant protein At1g64065-like [Salvia splendens]
MVETSEQIRPLAPASERPTSSDDEAAATPVNHRRRRLLRCCACVGAVLLIQAVVIVILIFTVFKVKDPDPVIRLNGVTVDRLDLINGTTTPQPGSNMSLTADVSVQNPNYASFRYPEMTSSLYYRGTEIGEARGPAGKARARRTARMNVTVEVIADRVTGQPELGSDINSGMLTLGSYTVVGGKVKILMVKKHDRITMNCSLTVNEETIKG